MAKISLWVGDGSLSSSATTLMDAFSIAELWHRSLAKDSKTPLFETEIITTDGKPITAYGNIRIEADRAAIEVKETDCVVFSPVLPNITPIPENLSALSDHIKSLRAKGTTLATVCTGTFVLAEMGLLDGKKATTNWMYARLFKKRYPKVKLESSYMLTEDDNIICAGASTAVYNLALHLIKKFGSQPPGLAVFQGPAGGSQPCQPGPLYHGPPPAPPRRRSGVESPRHHRKTICRS